MFIGIMCVCTLCLAHSLCLFVSASQLDLALNLDCALCTTLHYIVLPVIQHKRSIQLYRIWSSTNHSQQWLSAELHGTQF